MRAADRWAWLLQPYHVPANTACGNVPDDLFKISGGHSRVALLHDTALIQADCNLSHVLLHSCVWSCMKPVAWLPRTLHTELWPGIGHEYVWMLETSVQVAQTTPSYEMHLLC